MNDLISRSQAKQEVLAWAIRIGAPQNLSTEDTMFVIDNLPAVDAEVVRHGRWEKVKVWKDNPHTTLKCSACKTWQPIYEHDNWDYCPFCGAKMDAEVQE